MARNVGKIPDHQSVTALVNFYDEISRQVMTELLSVNVLNYTTSKANASKRKINGMIKRLNVVAVKSSKIYIKAAYDKARKIAVTSLEVLGREVDPDVPKNIHEKAIAARVKIASGFLIKANASIKVFVNRYFALVKRVSSGINQLQEFGNLDAEDEASIIRRIRNAVSAGKSRQVVAPQILDFFQIRIGEEKFITINDRHYQLKPYSKLVARTEMRNAQTDSVINSCSQYDNDLVEVSNHGTLTPICEPFEGEIYSLSGRSKDYPAASDYPPYHPNCQHYLIPTSEDAISFGGR